jgi:hypothetical protein
LNGADRVVVEGDDWLPSPFPTAIAMPLDHLTIEWITEADLQALTDDGVAVISGI